MVTNADEVVEDTWFEILEKGVVVRTIIEFPRSMYYRGHPKKRLRVNTLYRYENKSLRSSVDEFFDEQEFYEVAFSFFPRPIDSQSTVINRHKKEIDLLIANYQDQVRREELPPQK